MKQTRVLTEAAIVLAIYSILLVIAMYLPLIGLVAMFFLASPFIIFLLRNGIRAFFPMFLASFFISLFLGPLIALPLTFVFGIAGLVMGYFYHKKDSMLAIVGGTIAYLVTTVVNYIVSIAFFEFDIFKELIEEFKTSINDTVQLFSSFGQDMPEETIQQLNQFVDLFGYLLPTIFVFSSFVMAILTHVLNRPLLNRLKLEVQSLKPFREWRLPKSIIWYYLAAIILSFMNMTEGSFLHIASLNIIFTLQLLLLLQGFSFIFYYQHVKQLTKALSILAVVISLIIPYLTEFIRILGIIDLGFDLRDKLKR